MTTDTLTLSAFLLARLAEDEAVARDVIADTDVWSIITEEYVAPNIKYAATYMRRLTPERLLAECAAKRAIVECAQKLFEWDEMGSSTSEDGEFILASLANVYADHPDFDPDWA